jgi:hypothetical protein
LLLLLLVCCELLVLLHFIIKELSSPICANAMGSLGAAGAHVGSRCTEGSAH